MSEGKEVKKELQKKRPVTRTSPLDRFDLLSDFAFSSEMDRFFDDYLPRRLWQPFPLGWPGRLITPPRMTLEGRVPLVDVLDRENDFLVKAELPGVEKKDIKITIANNTLTIEASVNIEEKKQKSKYYRQEIYRGALRRSVEFPLAVKENEAKATFKNGMLELIIPKIDRAKRSIIKVE